MKVSVVKCSSYSNEEVYNKKKCISCYCCHELCPSNAIDLKRSYIMELISKIKRGLRI